MKTLEEKVIEIYEQVATMTITPSEARKKFMELISELTESMIPEEKKQEDV